MAGKGKIRTGILGGTFDPIHIGHLILAEAAYDAFDLDRVLIMPAPDPWHKSINKVTEFGHREAMIRLAIEGNPHLEFSDLEARLPQPTYTADTLAFMLKEDPDQELYFIMGGDALFSIEKWKRPEEIFANAIILASKRANETEGSSEICRPDELYLDRDNDGINDFEQVNTLQDEFMLQVEYLKEKFGARINDLMIPNIDISSSDIKKKIKEGKSVRYYLPDNVIEYIQNNCLYR